MSVVGVILMAGTFNLSEIVLAQQGFHWGISAALEPDRAPMPQLLGFLLFSLPPSPNQSRAI